LMARLLLGLIRCIILFEISIINDILNKNRERYI
jgi:hypothetical protein